MSEDQDDRATIAIRRARAIYGMVLVVLIAYTSVYGYLSLNGEYILGSSGETRVVGVAVADRNVWQPRHVEGYWRETRKDEWEWRGNALGMVFFPLLHLDWQIWHTHEYLFEDE